MSATTRFALLLALGLCAGDARANGPCELTLTYSGTLHHEPGPADVAGLDGAQFVWTGVFDPDAPPVSSGSGEDVFLGTVTLEITGSAGADGVYSSTTHRITEDDSGSGFLDFGGDGTFVVNGAILRPGAAVMFTGLDIGAGSPGNTLTPFFTADVSLFTDWTTGFLAASYSVSDA